MKRKTDVGLSRSMIGVLVGFAIFGLIAFSRELPAMRRYLRILRM